MTSIVDKEKQEKKTNVDPEVDKLLQDEQVRQLLLDPAVVNLMKALREEPDKAQWYEAIFPKIFHYQSLICTYRMMRTADASLRSKIQRLIDLGLLSIA